ncbi:MAG: pyridoxal phosphate-dependent decarboxylase family protein [Acidobacteriaceae bacterium]
MLEKDSLQVLANALQLLDAGFEALPPIESGNTRDAERMQAVLATVAERMKNNYPYFHPLYAGQMLKPPHPVARAAYALATWINPNNHARDGGRASSRMEIEAVRALAAMFGWQQYLGHLTSGGTFANLEALWVAGQLAPGRKIVASDQSHYTHNRISAVLGLPFASVASDAHGRMDTLALEALLQAEEIGTVVVTLGATATGAVDPLPRILELQEKYGFRIHVDAAYGGYFILANNLAPEARAAYDVIARADSIVVDPHKHGLQPYGCGSILFRDPSVGRFYKHDSPYTYFSSDELHLGEISLECSRAGASAVALWATQQLLPYVRGGEFAQGLQQCRAAALELYRRLEQDDRFLPVFAPELDIVVWAVCGKSVAESSQLAQTVFTQAATHDLHLALAQIPIRFFPAGTWEDASASAYVTCLRSVLMKPEHLEWIDAIWQRLDTSISALAG